MKHTPRATILDLVYIMQSPLPHQSKKIFIPMGLSYSYISPHGLSARHGQTRLPR